MTNEIEFLAATARVFDESRGLAPALTSLARMVVPALADSCAIQVLDGFQNVDSITIARRIDAEAEDPVSASQRHFTEKERRAPSHAGLLMELAAESCLVLPLSSRGGVLGSIAFGLAHPGGFSIDQIRWAEDFTRGVSLGLENARLVRMAIKVEHDRHDLFSAVLGSLRDPVAVYGKENQLDYVNDAFARFMGYASAGEVPSGFDPARINGFDVYDAEGALLPLERYSAARARRGDFQNREAMRYVNRETGEERWMQVTTLPLRDVAGEAERIVISSHDVTELKRLQAGTRQGMEMLDAGLNASPDSMVILDAAGRALYLNAAARRNMGYESEADLIGLSPSEMIAHLDVQDEGGKPLKIDDAEIPLTKVLRGAAKSASLLMRLRGKDGRIRWIENKAAAALDEWGRIRFVASLSTDVTRLKQAQDAAAIHEERLRLALDVGHVGIWELDPQTDQLNWSDRMCAMHGRSPLQPPRTQAEFLALIHGDDRQRVLSAFLAAEAQAHFEVEYRISGRFGEVRWYYTAGGHQRGRDGMAPRFLGAAIEITERKRTEAASSQMLKRVQQAKSMESIGRMAGGMSHDFNNLLTSINGYADLILSMAPGGKLKEYAVHIREAGERAIKITQQILAYSQRQMLETEVADINGIARFTADLVRKLVDERIQFMILLSPTPEPVRVDPGKLKQALLHVVMNSLDAMPNGGRITLSTFFTHLGEPVEANEALIPEGGYVVLEVVDTGVGIAPEIMPRIFEPYFTTKPMGVKSGLGLSLVQGVVKQHGGHIQVNSERGSGTRFRMYFPPADRVSIAP